VSCAWRFSAAAAPACSTKWIGIKVVVDPKSALYVTGSELDYVEALQGGGFKVTNPNAATTCSCGESFSA
jgi:iron-sulfur cluster assembly accessory protein